MRRIAVRTLVPLALAAVLAAPAAAVERQPHVKPKAAISPVRWALQAVNFVETRGQGTLGHAALVCIRAQTTQKAEDWQKVAAETRTLRDYLLAADPARKGLVVQSRALKRLLRAHISQLRRARVASASAQLVRAAGDHALSFAALREGADALDIHDCATARAKWTESGERSVSGQDLARQGLIQLRSAGFTFVDPDWAYE
jgi:hypothetical protein